MSPHNIQELVAMEPILGTSRDELEALQLERLRSTLQHAYAHNANYKRKFDAAGVHPDDLRTLADLARFPFTTKDDLREAYPFGFFSVPREQVARIHASSGTTGKPTVVGYTRNDLATWGNLVARSIRAAGGRAGMKVHVAYGYGLFTGGLGAHYGAEAAGCTVIPMSGGQTEKQVQLIRDFAPDIIMVTPSYMLAILDEFRRLGYDPRSTSLRIGIFGAEPWGDGMRAEIESAFDIDACDIYGLSEVMGPGVAQEFAGTKEGPTIWEDHFIAEIVDPGGRVIADGAQGELVFTSLTKQAMPVIRYRTRDLTRLLPGSLTAMRRMAKISGRTDNLPPLQPAKTDIDAGSWKTVLLTSPTQVAVAAPGATNTPDYIAQVNEIKDWQSHMSSSDRDIVRYWAAGAVLRWNEILRGLVAKHNLPPYQNADGKIADSKATI